MPKTADLGIGKAPAPNMFFGSAGWIALRQSARTIDPVI
jgi:hypothetical protein